MFISDPLREVFNSEVLGRLRSVAYPTEKLLLRLEILTASGPLPVTPNERWRVRWLRAKKAAWEVYIEAALGAGLFKGEHGADLRARLAGINDDDFRSALAECMACWLLAGKLRLGVSPRPVKRSGRVPDLLLHTSSTDVTIEVKAPYTAPPIGRVWSGDNSGILAKAADEANRQFVPGEPNVLFLVIDSDHPFFGSRGDLVRAFFGEDVFEITVNRETGETVSEQMKFSPRGKFLKLWNEGNPRFTRIGAVVRLRERLEERGGDGEDQEMWMEPNWVVLHNPFCPVRIPTDVWGECAQLIVDGDVLRWTDGKPILEF